MADNAERLSLAVQASAQISDLLKCVLEQELDDPPLVAMIARSRALADAALQVLDSRGGVTPQLERLIHLGL